MRRIPEFLHIMQKSPMESSHDRGELLRKQALHILAYLKNYYIFVDRIRRAFYFLVVSAIRVLGVGKRAAVVIPLNCSGRCAFLAGGRYGWDHEIFVFSGDI